MVEFTGSSITIGNTVAWVAAVLFAFVTNKIWVFNSRSWENPVVLREAGSFFAARIASAIMEIGGVPLLFSLGLNYPLFGIKGFAAKLVVSIIVVVSNYFFSKFFVFR